jgi:hypothetical protein
MTIFVGIAGRIKQPRNAKGKWWLSQALLFSDEIHRVHGSGLRIEISMIKWTTQTSWEGE